MTEQVSTAAHGNSIAPHTIDDATASAVRQVTLVAGIPVVGLAIIVVVSSLITWFQGGLGGAIVSLIAGALLSSLAMWVYNRVVLRPTAAIR